MKNIKLYLLFILSFLFFINNTNNVFASTILLEDDFTGTTIDTSKWEEYEDGLAGDGGSSGIVQQNGELIIENADNTWGGDLVRSVSTFDRSSQSLIIDVDITIDDCSVSGGGLMYGVDGNLSSGSILVNKYGENLTLWSFGSGGSSVSVPGTCVDGEQFHIKMVIKSAGGVDVYYDGSETVSASLNSTVAPSSYTYKRIILEQHGSALIKFDNLVVTYEGQIIPNAPYGLSVTNGDGQVDLSWSEPFSGEEAITDYIIEYQEDGAGSWTTFSDGTSTATTTTITGLTNGTLYNFRVSAVNSIGTGAFSFTVSSTPNNYLLYDDFTGTTIDTSKWEEYEDGLAGDGGTSGAVQQNEKLTIEGASNVWGDYGIRSVSTFDRSSQSLIIDVDITIDDCSVSGGGLMYGVDGTFSSGSILVNKYGENLTLWSFGSGGSSVSVPGTCVDGEQFHIKMVIKSAGGVDVYYDGSETVSASLNSTAAPSSYTYKKIILEQYGPVLIEFDNLVVSNAPSVPSGLSATNGDGQVTLSWSASTSNGSEITDYIIEYQEDGAGSWTTFSDGTSTATTTTVTGLTNGTTYNLRVSAVSPIGTGDASSSVYGNPTTSTPAAPIATSVSISGTAEINYTLTGSYTFFDSNGDLEGLSTYRWLISDTANGTYTPISGETSTTYTIASNNLDKYIKFEVTPVATESPTTGTPVLSNSIQVSSINYLNHILSTGQSLSVGYAGTPVLTTTQPYSNKMLDGSSLVPLIEVDLESMGSSMANTLTAFSSNESFSSTVTNNGIAGGSYEWLKKGSSKYALGISQATTVKSIADSLNLTDRVVAVTVIHGESDHLAGNGDYYESYLVEWQSDYDTDLKAITGQTDDIPMFTDQMSSHTHYNSATSAIPFAQLDASENNPGTIILVGPKYFLNYSSDGVHLTNESYRWWGEYYGKVLKKVLIDGESWRPLSPDFVTRNENIIYADFHVPEGQLTLDTTNVVERTDYGFEYYDSTDSASISSVEILDEDTVKITLSGTPTGDNQKLRYAYTGVSGTDAGAQYADSAGGNLRDTDSTSSLNGNSLYNWSVHFDKNITLDETDPVIYSISTTTFSFLAVINWRTNEIASTQVEYGLTDTLGATTTETDTSRQVSSHSKTITGLDSCSTYYYRILSTDKSGNQATGSVSTFNTDCLNNANIIRSASTDITTSGGTLSLSSGTANISLTIPSGYATSSSTFKIRQLDHDTVILSTSRPTDKTEIGEHIYDLQSFQTGTTTLTTFSQPVSITLTYEDSDITDVADVNEDYLKIYSWSGSAWEELSSCTVDTTLNTVTCSTTHFSVFGLFGGSVADGEVEEVEEETSSGGGGGGGTLNTKTTSESAEDNNLFESLISTLSNIFERDLKFGSVGEDVRKLQKILNRLGFVVSVTGPGSVGNETNYFGPATRNALINYQKSKDIVPAVGYFGPITRASLNIINAPTTTSPQQTADFTNDSTYTFMTDLSLGITHPDILKLQKILNNDIETQLTPTGPGSVGNETDYFGSITLDAVQRFQIKYGIVQKGSPGYGRVGPLTRGKLNEL